MRPLPAATERYASIHSAPMLEAIADPVRLRVVRHLDEHGPASLSELAGAAGVHVNTVRPHVMALEQSGILAGRQRTARGPGRRVIEYSLVEPLTLSANEFVGLAELLANALGRARLGAEDLRGIGADWGRYLSGRPAQRDPDAHVTSILAGFGYRVDSDQGQIRLERCLCPLIAPDSPLTVCSLMEGVAEGALAAAGRELRVARADHRPELRACRLRLGKRRRG
jgi:predicted ArsR family transcriptional regulator